MKNLFDKDIYEEITRRANSHTIEAVNLTSLGLDFSGLESKEV